MATVPSHLGVLQIEPTDHCNLACRMCAPHAERWDDVHGVPKGFLDVDLFRRVVDGLVADDCRFDHVILQWLGDPSLHPALEELIAVAGRGLAGRTQYLRFDTNAILLGPERIDRIFAMRAPDVPLLVVFTIDAATPDTYARVKGRDGWARATRHVRHLLARRADAARGVNVQLQFVVQPGNAHEAGDFLRYWEDAVRCHGFGDGHAEILFKRLSVGGGAAGQAAADTLYDATLARFDIAPREEPGFSVVTWTDRPWQRDDRAPVAPRRACPGPWVTPVIRHDGHLLVCCSDLRGELDLGSLDGASFRALWEGEKATRLRMAHLDGRFEGVCADCGGINWYALTEAHEARARARAAELGVR